MSIRQTVPLEPKSGESLVRIGHRWDAACDGTDVAQVISLLDRVVLSVPEAARQLRIPQSTLRHWLEGQTIRGKWYEPVLRPAPEGHNQVTWER